MTELIFIRHGQAGTRQSYDQLSELGREQSRMLGRHLAASGLAFDAIIRGTLRRHEETCNLVLEELDRCGAKHPEPAADPMWNEFDLDLVYQHIAPLLASADPSFARQYAVLQEQVQANSDGIHRRWTDADTAIIHAWVGGRFELPIESWDQFRQRILSAASQIPSGAGTVAVFTSATPVGICLGRALQLDIPRILRLAGAQYNTSITRLDLTEGEAILSTFNETSHLPAGHKTFR